MTEYETAIYNKERERIAQRLLCPFLPEDVEIRPGANIKGKSVPLFYVDPRVIEHRLRAVFGVGGFSTSISHLISNEDYKIRKEWNSETKKQETTGEDHGLLVSCAVEIRVHTPYMQCRVSNVGEKGLDEQGYNKTVSAFAQGLKRSAAQLGVGAYLYDLRVPPQPYDKDKGFGNFKSPPEDIINNALKGVGFKFQCEETGETLSWIVAAKTMAAYGRILGKSAILRLKEESQSGPTKEADGSTAIIVQK